MAITYSGSQLSIAAGVPATHDRVGYRSMSFKKGACALKEVPRLARTWTKVINELACRVTDYEIKGGAKWEALSFKLTKKPTDEAQAIYTALEDSQDGVGTFELKLPNNGGAFYFTAQVSMFSLVDGGSKNTIHTGSVELILQSDPVYVGDFRVPFGITPSVQFRFDTTDAQPYALDFNDGNGPQFFDSNFIHSHVFAISRSGFITMSLEDAARIEYLRFLTGPVQLNIADLKEMPELHTLRITSTQAFGDISNLASLTKLISIQAVSTDVHGDIGSLAGLESMVNVYFYATNIDGEGASIVNGNYNRFRLGIGMTSIEVGDTISALNEAGVSNCIIELGFDNAPAPNAVQGDIDALIARGCTVTVN